MCASRVIESVPPAGAAGDEDLFDMANLFPGTTGLPMTVWVTPRGGARHDVRVQVNMTHSNQMSATNTAVVGVRPEPRMIEGRLGQQDQQAVFAWVSRNTDPLVAYWNGEIDTAQLTLSLRRLS